MAILQPKTKVSTKVVSIRIPAGLHAEIEAIKQSADAAGLVFDVNDLLADALVKATRQARTELPQPEQPAKAATAPKALA